MLTEVLDTNPTADISFPSCVAFNVTPAYKGRIKGQAILGHSPRRYTHFTPVRGPTQHMKDILEKPETDISEPQPVEADKELLKTEKISKGEGERAPPTAELIDPKFKEEAKKYLEAPEVAQEDSYAESDEKDPVVANFKKDREVANIIAAAITPVKQRKPRKPVKKPKKRPPPKGKKITSFRIASKRK